MSAGCIPVLVGDDYTGGFRCDKCLVNFDNKGHLRFFCKRCRTDVCLKCHAAGCRNEDHAACGDCEQPGEELEWRARAGGGA